MRLGAGVPIEDFRLGPDRVTVRSTATAFGFEVPVTVEGDLVLSGGELVFEPRRTTALGTAVPDDISDQFLGQADLSYPLEGLPYGAEVTSVEVQPGRLVLAGQIERLRLGGRLITPVDAAKVCRGQRNPWRGDLGRWLARIWAGGRQATPLTESQ